MRGVARALAAGALGLLLFNVHGAAQQRPTFREILAGEADIDDFDDQFLDSRFPPPEPGRSYVLVGLHINPSAERLLVFSRDFKLVRELYGWELVTLHNESIVYHQSQVHFAPTHSLEISVFDPRTMIDRHIYPPATQSAVRREFIERVGKAYQAIGEDWFRQNNHHMDPERFDSSLLEPIAVDERAGTMSFPVSFGGGDPETFSERVLVVCAPLEPVGRIQCHETRAQ